MKTPYRITQEAVTSYAERNAALAKLGFSSYKVYLLSSIWKDIRKRVLLQNTRCRACGKKATQVHHNRYSVADLNGKRLDNLIPVCGGCHRKAEFSKIGIKHAPHVATNKLDNMRVHNQKKWRVADAKDAWKLFFTTLDEVRIYLGMDPSLEARELTEKMDAARAALPAKRYRKNGA
jgi:hypothetical protein